MNDPRRSGGPAYRTDWRAAGVGASWGAGIGALTGMLFPHERWGRVRQIRNRQTRTALLMTSVFGLIELILTFSLVLFVSALIPGLESSSVLFGEDDSSNPLNS